MGKDFENPFGITLKSGKKRMMSSLVDGGVFPGNQGGPLEHVVAAKAVAFREAQQDEYKTYIKNVVENAQIMGSKYEILKPVLRSKAGSGSNLKFKDKCLGAGQDPDPDPILKLKTRA